MNENINLCKILKGLEGIELYSSVLGKVKLIGISSEEKIEGDEESPYHNISVESEYTGVYNYKKDGRYISNLGECTLFPSKEQRDWSKFEKPIPIDTPIMCSSDGINWHLRYYNKYYNNKYTVFDCGYKHLEATSVSPWKYMIPYHEFNVDNIEESLKYNIQK